MGGKGGDSAPMMYAAQPDPVGHADPIDLSASQEYINAQKAAHDATAPDPVPPTDTPTQGDDAKTPGDNTATPGSGASDGSGTGTGDVAAQTLAAPSYWFNQPISTLAPKPIQKKGGSIKTTSGSV
jgi:hypothetical protein